MKDLISLILRHFQLIYNMYKALNGSLMHEWVLGRDEFKSCRSYLV